MNKRSCAIPFLFLAFAMLFGDSEVHAEPPRQLYLGINQNLHEGNSFEAAPIFIKKDTWHETMSESLKAAFTSQGESDYTVDSRPTVIPLKKAVKPIRVEFDVTGLKQLHVAVLGHSPLYGSADILRPRLYDQSGNEIKLTLGDSSIAGQVDSQTARATEMSLDGESYDCFTLSPGEISFRLDDKYERLKLMVHYSNQTALPPFVAVGSQPIMDRANKYHRVWEILWQLTNRTFRDQQSQMEMEMERRDGQWNEYAFDWRGAGNAYYLARAEERLQLAERTLVFVQQAEPRPDFAAALKTLQKRFQETSGVTSGGQGRELFAQAAALRREIILSHPLLDFEKLLFTKRPTPVLSAPGDNYYAMNNGAGPGLVILDGWKTDQPHETELLKDRLPVGCAMHPDLSFDGKRVVFAFADHTVDRDQRQFFLYEVGVDGNLLRQITGTDNDLLAGAGGRMTVLCEDYDPCYLPDGGIAFISTRNQGGVRCHNGDRYCPTYLLYRCESDGSNIQQISFGEANEWDPIVIPDGRIVWTRWDYINRPVIPTLGLWAIRPDGTSAGHFFGNYTANPCRICQARPIPNSRKMVATTAGHHTIHAGSLILIDHHLAEDGLDAITRLTPEASFPESEPYSTVSFSTPYPLSEDLFLTAFCPDPYPGLMNHLPRTNGYGIYLIDTLGGRELIYRDPTVSCFAPIPVQARPTPPVPTSLLADDRPTTGVFYLQDVYQSTQGIPRGSIRRIRVNELIPQPTQRVPYSSHVRFEVLKRVIGTVPVDESGSVVFEAPAGVPLQFQALDEDGMALMTMRTFTHLQPGEKTSCVGCHETRSAGPMNEHILASSTPLKLVPSAGPKYPGGLSFSKTVQPVLDRYCIDCHGLNEVAGDINLLGTIDATDQNIVETYQRLLPSTAYASLTKNEQLVRIAQYGRETWFSQPKDYFAHGGTLAQMLLDGHEGIELDFESRQAIIDWLDLNAPFYGTYSWNKEEWRRPDPTGEKELRAFVQQEFGDELAKAPFAALVNIALPSESRILKAPLAVSAGGWGQLKQHGWKSAKDPSFVRMQMLVDAAIQPLPYHDVAGTCGQDENCKCLSCWVRKIKEERQKWIAAKRK